MLPYCLAAMWPGIAAPMIVGIDWRLDYSVRSKHGMFSYSLSVPAVLASLLYCN